MLSKRGSGAREQFVSQLSKTFYSNANTKILIFKIESKEIKIATFNEESLMEYLRGKRLCTTQKQMI